MGFSNLKPVLIVVKHNVVHSARVCEGPHELEKEFKNECEDHGICPTKRNYDDGYMQLEDGTSICMTWAD